MSVTPCLLYNTLFCHNWSQWQHAPSNSMTNTVKHGCHIIFVKQHVSVITESSDSRPSVIVWRTLRRRSVSASLCYSVQPGETMPLWQRDGHGCHAACFCHNRSRWQDSSCDSRRNGVKHVCHSMSVSQHASVTTLCHETIPMWQYTGVNHTCHAVDSMPSMTVWWTPWSMLVTPYLYDSMLLT